MNKENHKFKLKLAPIQGKAVYPFKEVNFLSFFKLYIE